MGRDTTCNYILFSLKDKSVLGVNSWRVPKQHGISRARGLNQDLGPFPALSRTGSTDNNHTASTRERSLIGDVQV